MDKLPQELVEYIIDFLHDDPITLNACSLTGHAWCSAARQHTFGTINISTKSHIASLEKSNGPFSYTQTLSIWPKCATMRILNASGWSRLANLTNLSLQCELPSFGIELDDALQLFLDNFPVLETLTIRNSRVRSLGTIMRAIHLLPRLSDLILDQVYWSKGYDTSDPEFPLSTFRLRHIQLLNMQIEPLVSCLLKLHPKLGLWSFTAETQHNTLPHLLQSCRESLRTLDLRQSQFHIHFFLTIVTIFSQKSNTKNSQTSHTTLNFAILYYLVIMNIHPASLLEPSPRRIWLEYMLFYYHIKDGRHIHGKSLTTLWMKAHSKASSFLWG